MWGSRFLKWNRFRHRLVPRSRASTSRFLDVPRSPRRHIRRQHWFFCGKPIRRCGRVRGAWRKRIGRHGSGLPQIVGVTADEASSQDAREPPDCSRVGEQGKNDDDRRTIREPLAQVEKEKGERPREGTQNCDHEEKALLARSQRRIGQYHCERRPCAWQPPGVAIQGRKSMGGHGRNCAAPAVAIPEKFHTQGTCFATLSRAAHTSRMRG